MTFDGFDLTSFDRIKHSFPSLDQHVSVENGICYLSLLEQFTQLRTTFADCLDAFHARAELRYELWIRGCQNRSSLGISFSAIIPPIGKQGYTGEKVNREFIASLSLSLQMVDVAYISHAHLVSPFRYYEDCQRMMPHMLCFSMPLLQLVKVHFLRSNILLTVPFLFSLCISISKEGDSRTKNRWLFGQISVPKEVEDESLLLWRSMTWYRNCLGIENARCAKSASN